MSFSSVYEAVPKTMPKKTKQERVKLKLSFLQSFKYDLRHPYPGPSAHRGPRGNDVAAECKGPPSVDAVQNKSWPPCDQGLPGIRQKPRVLKTFPPTGSPGKPACNQVISKVC